MYPSLSCHLSTGLDMVHLSPCHKPANLDAAEVLGTVLQWKASSQFWWLQLCVHGSSVSYFPHDFWLFLGCAFDIQAR